MHEKGIIKLLLFYLIRFVIRLPLCLLRRAVIRREQEMAYYPDALEAVSNISEPSYASLRLENDF